MFTGIIASAGRVTQLEEQGGDQRLWIDAEGLIDQGGAPELGESIAVNGVCLTAQRWEGGVFVADVSAESLRLTTLGQLQRDARVNLERALRADERLGGHLVSGHVDGLATVNRIDEEARSLCIWLAAPEGLARYIARKGSVCLDGISLTVNAVRGHDFSVNIVPHTASVTTIGGWTVGQRVNLEVDLVARYLERLLEARNES